MGAPGCLLNCVSVTSVWRMVTPIALECPSNHPLPKKSKFFDCGIFNTVDFFIYKKHSNDDI
ncbi:MAG: hypothetical protein ACI93R_003008 [Flavobacteriales bacterium]|jgi:hypothetical protein